MAINVLGAEREDLARQFATPMARTRRNGPGVAWDERVDGTPWLDGRSSGSPASLRDRIPGGDHVIVIGEVLTGGAATAARCSSTQGRLPAQ